MLARMGMESLEHVHEGATAIYDRLLGGIILLVVIGFFGNSAYEMRHLHDGDSAIYLSYSKQIAEGDWFSFNPGEFSSGSTSPLWAVILAISFFFSDPPFAAKIISAIATAAALSSIYVAAYRYTRLRTAAALSLLLPLWQILQPGLFLFETPLIVLLIALLAIVSRPILVLERTDLTRADAVRMGVLYALIPLVRPEAVVLVILHAGIVAITCRKRGSLVPLATALVSAAIPSVLYFGYSWMVTGYPSISAVGRAFSLRESAPSVFGRAYSLAAFDVLLAYPVIVWTTLFFVGWYWARSARLGWGIRWFALGAFLIYVALQTVVNPATSQGRFIRYTLAVTPLLSIFYAVGIVPLLRFALPQRYIVMIVLVSAALCWQPLVEVQKEVVRRKNLGMTWEITTEKHAMEYINEVAEPGDAVLAYEVQPRYYLRDDLKLYSLDGITDPRILPYLEGGDLAEYLKEYKPEYWLANRSVEYRPYLQRSLLAEVVKRTGDEVGASTTIDGITFTNIRLRQPDEPTDRLRWFAYYRQIYKLSYGDG